MDRPMNRRSICPHCEGERLTTHHYRDAADLTPAAAEAAGYCPELARRRTPSDRADLDLCTTGQAELAELLYCAELELS